MRSGVIPADESELSKRPLVGGERIRGQENDGTYSAGTVASVDYDEDNPIEPLPYFWVDWDGCEESDCYPLEALSDFEILPS